MLKLNVIWLVIPVLVSQPVQGQPMIDSAAVHAGAAGLGAGLAASRDHGRLVQRSYESALLAQQAAAAQTKAIEQYVKAGSQYEAKKDWEQAEKSFKYALQVVAMRDGPGSPNSVPVLRHLVSVNEAQGNLQDAIGFQQTVVAFAKATKMPNMEAVVREQLNLTDLFIKKEDYTSAEPVLQQVLSKPAAIKEEQRIITLDTYGKVLRKMRKYADAERVEAELEKQLELDRIARINASKKSERQQISDDKQDAPLQSQPDVKVDSVAKADLETKTSETSINTPPVDEHQTQKMDTLSQRTERP